MRRFRARRATAADGSSLRIRLPAIAAAAEESEDEVATTEVDGILAERFVDNGKCFAILYFAGADAGSLNWDGFGYGTFDIYPLVDTEGSSSETEVGVVYKAPDETTTPYTWDETVCEVGV